MTSPDFRLRVHFGEMETTYEMLVGEQSLGSRYWRCHSPLPATRKTAILFEELKAALGRFHNRVREEGKSK